MITMKDAKRHGKLACISLRFQEQVGWWVRHWNQLLMCNLSLILKMIFNICKIFSVPSIKDSKYYGLIKDPKCYSLIKQSPK